MKFQVHDELTSKLKSIFEIRHSKEMVNMIYQEKKNIEERFSSFEKMFKNNLMN